MQNKLTVRLANSIILLIILSLIKFISLRDESIFKNKFSFKDIFSVYMLQ